ncbi:MAG: ATPase, T2SS/T4P/T4SS family [Candidatus Saelkia tenebricola]|nr:ATPase, T2SS/T4P/T4SS family [Candidatus Saelkia tenebricola]
MQEDREERLIGRILVNAGIILEEELEKALAHHKRTGDFLATSIVKLKIAKEEDVFKVLAKQLGVAYINLKKTEINPEAVKKVPAKFALHYQLMPFAIKDNVLEVALGDPLNIQVIDDLKMLINIDVRPYLASEESIMDAIRKIYGLGAGTVEGMLQKEDLPEEEHVEIEEDVADSSIINFVNQILSQAIRERATDVHIEPFEDEIIVRYRIDGMLHKIPLPSGINQFQSTIASRIKVMASLNIAEKRLPQDGRILFKSKKQEYDMRISTLPTPHGESIDLRILSKDVIHNLKDLGLSKHDSGMLEELIADPNGIIFVTGPTGSGKTTTLYTCLQKLNTPDRKIITIEDPIEYRIKGITQIQVYSKIGLTFGGGLRSILRHDPDIILIGEVRDVETAEIAVRSSLTGHLVFSTLHTNDAASAVTRLLDMGIEPYLIASTTNCIIAQRLIRVICNKCKKEVPLNKEILETFNVKEKDVNIKMYRGTGCDECFHTGYKGRIAIYEFLIMNDAIRKLVSLRATAVQIKEEAMKLKMSTLKMDGWEKIKLGITTPEEVLRVTSGE